MIESEVKALYNVEFKTPTLDRSQSLNFYEIPPSIKIKTIPNLLNIIKKSYEQNKTYLIFNNINKIRKISNSEQNLPLDHYFCLLWTRNNGEKYGLLLEKVVENDYKCLGIWNFINYKDLKLLESKISDDLEHIQDVSRFKDVSVFL